MHRCGELMLNEFPVCSVAFVKHHIWVMMGAESFFTFSIRQFWHICNLFDCEIGSPWPDDVVWVSAETHLIFFPVKSVETEKHQETLVLGWEQGKLSHSGQPESKRAKQKTKHMRMRAHRWRHKLAESGNVDLKTQDTGETKQNVDQPSCKQSREEVWHRINQLETQNRKSKP